MSVIQRIRDKGAWIIFAIIALALIAFILQDGMGSRGSFFGNTTTLGKVNGQVIDREQFENKVNLYSQGGQDRSFIIPQLWNMEVDKILLEQECAKLGITVTGKEIADDLFGPNSPLAREPQFQDENGQFKADEARQAFAQLKKSGNAQNLEGVMMTYIEPIKQRLLNTKYQNFLQQSAYVPTWLVEKQKADNAAISSISYVYVPYTTIPDSTIKVTDNDIMAYVKKHAAAFERPEETRVFSYVSFNAAPSKQDSLNTYNQVLALKEDFAKTNDAQAFLGRVGSEIPYLDGYLQKSALKMQQADSIKNLPDGALYGPYLDGNNYVIAKMIGKRILPDSVKVRHILVKTQDRRNPVLADSIAKKRIDSVEALAKAPGADFDALVQKYSDDGGSKKTKGEYEFSLQQFNGISKEFAEAIFYGKAGDKKVVKVENDAYAGYHYIEVISQKNFGDAVKVAYLAKSITASNETVNNALTAASQFASSIKNKKDFDEEAAKKNLQVMISQEVKMNDFTIPNFGQASARGLIRWLYEHSINDVSEPTEINDNYIVAIITNINKKGLASAAAARPMAENYVRNEKKAQEIIKSKFIGNTLEDIAKSSGSNIVNADSIAYNNPVIPEVGYDLRAVGASFNKDAVGKLYSPIAGNSGVFAIRVNKISATSTMQSDEQIRQSLLANLRNAYYGAINALKAAATIKDYLFKFY